MLHGGPLRATRTRAVLIESPGVSASNAVGAAALLRLKRRSVFRGLMGLIAPPRDELIDTATGKRGISETVAQ